MKNNCHHIVKLGFVFPLFFLFSFSTLSAQEPKNRIAIFTPIYIDSAFNGSNFKIWQNNLPKNMIAGLEFYNGVQMAIDSLNNGGISNLIIDIYDYKNKGNSIAEIIKNNKNNLVESKIIIANFNSYTDIKLLAEYANLKKIPLISASYPNDGGVTNNPYFFLINPTIQTHTNAIYRNIVTNFQQTNIIYIKCKGYFENMVDNYFKEYEKTISIEKKLNLNPIQFVDTFSADQFYSKLDSTLQNTILCNCSKEAFAQRVLTALALRPSYYTTVIGMPTWDALKNLTEPEYKGVTFNYTSAYNYSASSSLLQFISKSYESKYFTSINDNFLKGYETMLRVGKLVSLYGNNAITLLSDDLFRVFNEFKIEAKFNSKNQIEYFENKKIYTITKLSGEVINVE